MPNFFIDRPIFAWVIAIIIMLAGGAIDPQIAGSAISNDCAACDFDHSHVSRG
ncbi:Acriflavine resistance protein B [Kluyvera intermedia]|nr:Acriflavine resistance protein B [Kluyvera intermedia]